MKKRVLAILLVLSMVSVTACGAKKQDASKKSEDKVRVIKQADIEEDTEETERMTKRRTGYNAGSRYCIDEYIYNTI